MLVNSSLDVAGNTNVERPGVARHNVDVECFHNAIIVV